jgi:L-alanine-DL-glutamate epimerase-like enolase superfamily enzyme/enoyl-CoA hydratase/carnithine racemase
MDEEWSAVREWPVLTLQRLGDSGVAKIVLNRPEKRNALSHELIGAFMEALDEIRADDTIHAVITAANGPVFSAGLDLHDVASRYASRLEDWDRATLATRLYETVRTFPRILIAQVHGYCLGGAVALLSAHDLAIAASDAQIGKPEIIRGSFGQNVTAALLHAGLPFKKVALLQLSGRNWSGAEADRLGLVSASVERSELESFTLTLAREIASRHPAVLAHAKIAVHLGRDLPLRRPSRSTGSSPRACAPRWTRRTPSRTTSSPRRAARMSPTLGRTRTEGRGGSRGGRRMKITKVKLRPVVQPLEDKNWKFGQANISEHRGLLIDVCTQDGPDGLAYATAALHLGEVIDGMHQVIDELFVPILVGADPFDIERLMERIDHSVLGFPRAKSAIEIALFDLVGKALGVPLYKLWGGLYRDRIPVVRIIPIMEPAEMARRAEAFVAAGFKHLKIKVGHDARLDIQRVLDIRSAVGPDVELTLDANGAWSPKMAIETLRRMDDADVWLIEQPVRPDDLAGLAAVRAAVRPLVEADESAKSVEDIYQLALAGCVDAVILKTPKLGGPREVRKAAAICEAANLRCRMGMGGASRLTSAVDMHLIASTPNIAYACEVGEFSKMAWDPTEGVEIVDGMIAVPHLPGHGATFRATPG